MAIRIRWIFGAILILSLLTACTRRSDEPIIQADDTVATAAVEELAPAEPQVEAAPTSPPDGAASDDEDEATDEATTAAEDEDEPLRPDQTFQYTVQEGDNLSFLAEKFGTTMETLRALNFLTDDNIQSGAILVVPYVEGITAEGLPTPLPGPYEYTVQQGDTLGDLAFRFDVSTIDIIEANELLTPDSLIVGTTLVIPGYVPEAAQTGSSPAPSAATGSEFVTYIVQPNDTFSSIAQAYGIEADDLAAANNIVNRNVLRIGQELVIPGVTERDELIRRGQTHTVASGETLSQIAAQYGVDVDAILTLNELTDANAIVVGQELIIPGE